MKQNYDIIINYSIDDDQPQSGHEKGWVSSFGYFLENFLSQMMGRKPQILMVADSEKIEDDVLSQTSIFASVISTSFHISSLAIDRLNHFYDISHQAKIRKVEPNNRIFKFVKEPSKFEDLPEHLEEILSYNFYKVDSYTGDATTISNFFNNDPDRLFWLKMVDVAFDIHKVLQKLSGDYDKTKEQVPIIFLADVGLDLILERDIIKRELQRHGYRVLPDQMSPKKNLDLFEFIKNELNESLMAIHLIGEDYGFVPKDGELSVAELQFKLSAEKSLAVMDSKDTRFSRIIWINPESRDVDPRQEQFVDSIRKDAEGMDKTDVLQCSLEELKSIIRNELHALKNERKSSFDEMFETAGNVVYLMYEKKDISNAEQIEKQLRDEGFECLKPSFDKKPLEMRNLHFQHLRRADHALIFSHLSNERWAKTKIQDILKSPGMGRNKSWKTKLLVSGGNKKLETKLSQNAQIVHINWEGEMDTAALTKITQEIQIKNER